MKKHYFLIFSLLAAIALCACHRPTNEAANGPSQLPGPATSLGTRAVAAWNDHFLTLERIARGEHVDLATFGAACDFFHRVAGIDVPGTGAPEIGWYATKDTPRAIPGLRAWYAANGSRLYWDEATQSVRVRPPSG